MIGQTILHYKILEKLGEGGMGVVYLAEDIKLKRNVAIKFLPKHIAANAGERQRFEVEAQAAASLNHPNIATIHAIEQSEEQSFIVMEFVEGKTIKKLVELDGKSFTIKKVLEIAIQVCEGLNAAHEKGIVHRDVKSDNVMLTPKGQVKIMDFGLAKIKGGKGLTAIGSTVGTAAYMSPEQAQGEDVDRRSDIFSFGVVLYEMLTTRLPFDAEHQAALIYSVINENPQPIARYNDNVSADLERIVFKCLAKDKEERYQHVDDILADLRRERKNLEYAHSGYIKASTTGQTLLAKGPGKEISKYKKVIRIIIPSFVVILFAVIFFLFNPFKSRNSENQVSAAPSNSLAVMYFENIPDPADKDHNSEMLTSLLITSLSQVKGLEVISRERLLNIQKDMGQTDSKTISSSIAEQVAKRAGVATMLVGSILQEKPMLAVSTRLIDVQTGKIISSQQVTNFKPDKIFNLVDSISVLIQNNLQTPSLQNDVKSVAEVTTKSPEAYRAYVAGLELYFKIYIPEAIAAFSRAIELDNNFAMAYFELSIAQGANGTTALSQNSLKKAVELADKTTDRERLQILTYNYVQQNNISKAIDGYKQLIEKYPHDINSYIQLGWTIYDRTLLQPEQGAEILSSGLKIEPASKVLHNVLAYSYAYLNKKQEAIDAASKYINLAPAEPNPYDTQGDIYTWFREYDLSLASYQKAISLRADFSTNYKIGTYYLLKQQYDLAKKYFQACNYELPLMEVYQGQIQSAEKKFSGLPESQITRSNKLRSMINLSYESAKYTEMLRLARQLSEQLKKDPTDKIYGRNYLAWALIKNGKSSETHSILDQILKDVNGVSPLLQVVVDYSSALVSYEEEKYDQALDTFRKVFQSIPPNHEPNIFYGITLLKTGQTLEAISEFQRLIFWPQFSDVYFLPGVPGADLDWPVPQVKAHYWLGVAYEKQGNKNKALNEYKKFLEIWKDADFNSPEIKDAKMRSAKLK
jgi:serine/threonine protein kinase